MAYKDDIFSDVNTVAINYSLIAEKQGVQNNYTDEDFVAMAVVSSVLNGASRYQDYVENDPLKYIEMGDKERVLDTLLFTRLATDINYRDKIRKKLDDLMGHDRTMRFVKHKVKQEKKKRRRNKSTE